MKYFAISVYLRNIEKSNPVFTNGSEGFKMEIQQEEKDMSMALVTLKNGEGRSLKGRRSMDF